jgi:hypothetical protein
MVTPPATAAIRSWFQFAELRRLTRKRAPPPWTAPLGVSNQLPVAANQELPGLVTKTIGAIHGLGSVTSASISLSPPPLTQNRSSLGTFR